VAREWGYLGGNNYATSQALAERAQQAGYDVIKFKSLRGSGNNFAVLDNFEKLLRPQMVSPVPKP
jgi:hypothetical protein